VHQRVAILTNPAAGRGRAREVIARVLASTGGDEYFLQATTHPGDERRAVLAALDRGCSTLVAVGGDGTWSKVAAAMVEAKCDCRLALVAAGTGNDFAKSVGAPARDIEQTLRLAREGPDILIDVLRVGEDICVNVAGFGFDAHVLASIRPVPLLSGDALYLYSAARELFLYRGLQIDAGDGPRNHLILAACNGRHFGGQFNIAPNARLDDGLMDIIAIHDASPLQRMALFASVIAGTHTTRSGVTEHRVAETVLRFPTAPIYEIDGELRRASKTELTLSIEPRALRVVTAAADRAAH
jgi:diacylglycerol kinase (ATP)